MKALHATLALAVILATLAPARADERLVLAVGPRSVSLVDSDKLDAVLSEACVPPEAHCQARDALARAKLLATQPRRPSPFAGAENGALVCRELGGAVTMGRDPKGNELGLCRFADDSLVGSSSLAAAARPHEPPANRALRKAKSPSPK
ncbi:MAG: DUF333 domain-containing protein [Deltaproteobacteria bacterium]|nr:DUF333 domain-containing protein [Deltaproteobacteria bacterium]